MSDVDVRVEQMKTDRIRLFNQIKSNQIQQIDDVDSELVNE